MKNGQSGPNPPGLESLPWLTKADTKALTFYGCGLPPSPKIAKDYLLTLAKSRLALGSPVVYLVGCHHAKNGLIHRKMVITSKVKQFSRPH